MTAAVSSGTIWIRPCRRLKLLFEWRFQRETKNL